MTTQLRDYESTRRQGYPDFPLTIGVRVRPEDRAVAREFFELFKTPWEFCREGQQYAVLIQADGTFSPGASELSIVFSSTRTPFDEQCESLPGPARGNAVLSFGEDRIPLYGLCASLPTAAADLLVDDSGDPVATVTRVGGQAVVRVGYDLFTEIRTLLTVGQPAMNASIPTLERHIALLRRFILDAGLPVVEVPAIAEGHQLIVCLTHDVDHPSIRLHRLDHTFWGFLYRALVGSVVNVFRGRMSLAALGRNVRAALSLPLVYVGWARDFWSNFDRYLEIERGLGSTFFFLPSKGTPGRRADGPAPSKRAGAYDIADVAQSARALASAGCDVGLHGIDAWLDSASGMAERGRISAAAGAAATGVRMHWLYADGGTPERLEEAGFEYDSTFGYNDTVGFRAGTLQAFKPIAARHLLELPLSIMDTALFYPAYLDLSREAARDVVGQLLTEAERSGGAVTINWHDRSLGPERLWDAFYVDLVADLKRRAAWFPTAAQAVAWFQRRRSARFHIARLEGNTVRIAVTADTPHEGPGLTLRVHRPESRTFTDVPFKDSLDARVEI